MCSITVPISNSAPAKLRRPLKRSAKLPELVQPTERLTISDDDTDNRFYECAEAASADCIVTGNRKHFPKPHKNVRIIGARQLLNLLSAAEK
jgi:predicted nucleic acid-binding protein